LIMTSLRRCFSRFAEVLVFTVDLLKSLRAYRAKGPERPDPIVPIPSG
jgi:hypothetical protein